nr:11704_t:CDS:2 [Entrophospora candida]
MNNANTSNADANNKATSSSTTTTHQKATTDSTASSSLATDQQNQQNSHPHNHTTEQKKQQTDYNNDPEQIQQEQQKGFKGQAKKDMQKVEGYVAEKEGEGIDEEKLGNINEMEVTRSVADKYLRENKGDVVEALRALSSQRKSKRKFQDRASFGAVFKIYGNGVAIIQVLLVGKVKLIDVKVLGSQRRYAITVAGTEYQAIHPPALFSDLGP